MSPSKINIPDISLFLLFVLTQSIKGDKFIVDMQRLATSSLAT